WKKLLFFLVLLTVLVPPQVIITPSFLTFRTLGLVNNPLAFYLPALLGSGLKGGLFIFIFRHFFRGLPKELEEAAAIDGCGFMHCFLRIVIPNAGAVFLMAVILSFIWYWNDYYMGSMYMRNVNTVTLALERLPAASQSMTGDIAYDPFKVVTLMQAGSLLTIVPPLLAYLFLQRKFVQGVQRSGIVG
ncbi:MAG: ABC transporter permease subunit, partial [Oscillospiraceae bacterium]|nr:ABC transporter permease subunit [Oscillospiraceae bacterium]